MIETEGLMDGCFEGLSSSLNVTEVCAIERAIFTINRCRFFINKSFSPVINIHIFIYSLFFFFQILFFMLILSHFLPSELNDNWEIISMSDSVSLKQSLMHFIKAKACNK